jgi:fatty-acyl-CoA synthase
MMDYQLTLDMILRRAEELFPRKQIVSRLPDRRLHHYTYADLGRRARALAAALCARGYADGTRIATLCWNHHQHLETYFGVPLSGNVIHTLNIRLHPDDLAYIVADAGARVLILDESLLPVYEQFSEQVSLDEVVVVGDAPLGTTAYESLVDGDSLANAAPDIRETDAALLCYTSGTTGRPKGVLYSHRSLVLHALACSLPGSIGPTENDVTLPVVPMFHANAWGYPHAATLVGATQVLPGPFVDPQSLVDTFEELAVTLTAAVPTVWLGVLELLDADPTKYDLSALRRLIVGGSAASASLLAGFEERHGIRAIHAWGMTEMAPLGSVCELTSELVDSPPDERLRRRAKQGMPVPMVEMRARGEDGFIPRDGVAVGELEVRGPFVASAYFADESAGTSWTEDGWFRTGDMVSIDEHGYMEIHDRLKDMVKSGGEWISSIALENALMTHPAVREAAVVAVLDERWGERPLACVVLAPGAEAEADELRAFLMTSVAKWWVPDTVTFIDEIPRTAVGKFDKAELRRRFADYSESKGTG